MRVHKQSYTSNNLLIQVVMYIKLGVAQGWPRVTLQLGSDSQRLRDILFVLFIITSFPCLHGRCFCYCKSKILFSFCVNLYIYTYFNRQFYRIFKNKICVTLVFLCQDFCFLLTNKFPQGFPSPLQQANI